MNAQFFAIWLMVLGCGHEGTGVTELLDAADPKVYLESRQISYAPADLIKVIEARPTRKLEEVKRQEVSKLLAARALGDLKSKAALPSLKKMAESKRRFEADYANAAIAKIEGREYARTPVAKDVMLADLNFLPATVGAVVQARLNPGAPAPVGKLVAELEKGAPAKLDALADLANFHVAMASVAEMVGNVRLDGVTIGATSDIDDDGNGAVAVLVRGSYDSRGVEALLAEIDGVEHEEFGGTLFAMFGSEMVIAPVSDELFVLVAGDFDGPASDFVGELGKRLKEKPQALALDKQLAATVKRASGVRLWGAVKVSPSYRMSPYFAPFDEIVLRSEKVGKRKRLRVTIAGTGNDAGAVKAAITQLSGDMGQVITEVQDFAKKEPAGKPFVDFLSRIQYEAKGKSGQMVIELDRRGVSAIALLGLLTFENM